MTLSLLPLRGLTSRIKATNPAIKGNSIIARTTFELSPRRLKSFGWAASPDNIPGSVSDLNIAATNRGMAPMLFDTRNTVINMTAYRQKLFLPVNDDSR